MMRPKHLLVPAVLIGLGACSALRPAERLEQDATYRLDRGLRALDAGQYREAFDDLVWVESHCAGHVRGAEAHVALAALELDPRNERGRAGLGTDLLGQLLRDPAPPAWVRPLAETSYLMALSLGAPPAPGMTAEPRTRPASPAADEPAHGCGRRVDAGAWAAPRLPELPGPGLAARLSDAETTRNAAAARADSVGRELERVTQRLAETEAELERIRKTLQP
ncbi:MAG TPA: hypothetical protein VMM83_02850 [Longimicrobiales bacterium]|nr:hypothetical protein [Longimicrobiales bacterium]